MEEHRYRGIRHRPIPASRARDSTLAVRSAEETTKARRFIGVSRARHEAKDFGKLEKLPFVKPTDVERVAIDTNPIARAGFFTHDKARRRSGL